MKTLSNYINENLKTHDSDKLQKKLLEIYGDEIISFEDLTRNKDVKNKSFSIKIKTNSKKLSETNLKNHSDKIEAFWNLVDFYNYGYDKAKKVSGITEIVLDPIYPEEVSDYFNKYNRQAYHITHAANKREILKNGLIVNRNVSEFTNIPKRIYLWVEEEPFVDDIKQNNMDKVFEFKPFTPDIASIFKVDLSKLNFDVYQDARTEERQAIFVNNNIPAKYLTLIDPKKYLSNYD